MKRLLVLGIVALHVTNIYAKDPTQNTQCPEPLSFYKLCIFQEPHCETINYTNCDDHLYGKTFFAFRPQDSSTMRRAYSLSHKEKYDTENWINLFVEYQHSFNTCGIAEWFFFNGRNCMTVGIPDAETVVDVDGSQLGLSLGSTATTLTPGIIGSICARPLVANAIFDLDFHIDLSNWSEGLWIKVDVPVVHTKTNMRFCSSGKGVTDQTFPIGLFGAAETPNGCARVEVVYDDILDAFCGGKDFGSVEDLKSAKYSPCALSTTKIAGIHVDLGYDFHVRDDYSYVAAAVHVVGPTGTRPCGKFVFEPVAGANASWQLGLTLLGYHRFLEDNFALYAYVQASHLFKARQNRVFALKANGPGSQYLLLKEIDATNAFVDSAERTANVYNGEVRIGANIMVDATAMIEVKFNEVLFNVGYNFWARSHEKRDCSVCFRNSHFIDSTFGVKGNSELSIVDPSIGCISDEFTASGSTIAKPAEEDSANVQPVLIKPSDINYAAPLHPSTWSHTLFASIGYNGAIGSHTGSILAGASIEFGTKNKAINYGSIFVQGGFEF